MATLDKLREWSQRGYLLGGEMDEAYEVGQWRDSLISTYPVTQRVYIDDTCWQSLEEQLMYTPTQPEVRALNIAYVDRGVPSDALAGVDGPNCSFAELLQGAYPNLQWAQNYSYPTLNSHPNA
jgi:hypothetical protein